jgi:hypothetical protein
VIAARLSLGLPYAWSDGRRGGCRAAFFSTCGSSLSLKSAMIAGAGPEEKLLINRNAHKSVVASVIIAGILKRNSRAQSLESKDLPSSVTGGRQECVDCRGQQRSGGGNRVVCRSGEHPHVPSPPTLGHHGHRKRILKEVNFLKESVDFLPTLTYLFAQRTRNIDEMSR